MEWVGLMKSGCGSCEVGGAGASNMMQMSMSISFGLLHADRIMLTMTVYLK